ncbi:hypothetical protein Patl1_33080 [Pistacia atlantica]|uniref:Uncharacterized protein n=1 Tax=Pistacia atlantica TaxID=434234 RepID=A0ACC1AQB0_9ROSI|nr:hypothetical protein Patl1_33080 [Pistacia atlantica]
MKNQNDPVTLQWKVLGFGHENAVFVPSLNPYLGDDPCSAACSWWSSLCCFDFTWEDFHLVRVMQYSNQNFLGGYGGFGALGHSVYHRELFPRLVEGPNEGGGLSIPSKVKALPVPMADVGQLWNWGASSNYELGRGDKVGGWRPKPIPSLEDVRIIQIARGGCHSLALTDEGKVLSWRYGGHGQLGHSSTENQKVPVVIEERVVYIACGAHHKGKLYMWGNAKDSQLGVPGLPEVMLLQWSTNQKVFSTHLDTTNKYVSFNSSNRG